VRAKFRAYEELRSLLLSTGDDLIVDRALGDDFWECGPTDEEKIGSAVF
jgi:predicted NAD-dependent protein-ADP-ribosyltransferase YbiA (DUF1768 family)